MSNTYGDQLYKRSMGMNYDQELLRREVANGFRSASRFTPAEGALTFPEYDGTDDFSSIYERPEGAVEVKTDEHSHEEWLEIAGRRVTDMIGRLNENKLKKTDIDPELVVIVSSIEEKERALNEALSEEHPKMTAALGEWLSRDEGFQGAETPEAQATTSVEFYESVMVELSTEKTTYESELGMWIENNQNQPRIDELINGIAQYNQFIEIANHHRLEELASLYKAEIERLYALAA